MKLLLLAIACSGVSTVLLRKGMLRVGPLEDWRPTALLRYGLRAITQPYVALGVAAGLAHFGLWLVVLSFVEVSFALPITALEYAFVAILGLWFLAERVGPMRWAAIGMITLGVFLMVRS